MSDTEKRATNFEISKKLSELNFDSENHFGWWKVMENGEIHFDAPDVIFMTSQKYTNIKAYDCYSLLMWMHETYNGLASNLTIYSDVFVHCDCELGETESDKPQNTLGLAIIKMLEERGNDK